MISSVNWAEVVQKSITAEVDVRGMLEDLKALGLQVEPFTAEDGETTGQLWTQTRQAGLSLGDQAKPGTSWSAGGWRCAIAPVSV